MILERVAHDFPGYNKFVRIATDKMKVSHAAERTGLAVYLQDEEREIIEVAYKWFKESGMPVCMRSTSKP